LLFRSRREASSLRQLALVAEPRDGLRDPLLERGDRVGEIAGRLRGGVRPLVRVDADDLVGQLGLLPRQVGAEALEAADEAPGPVRDAELGRRDAGFLFEDVEEV